QLKRSMGQGMEMRYPGAALRGDLQFEDDRISNVLTLTMTYDVPNLAGEKEGTCLVRFQPVNLRGALPVAPMAGRKAPFLIPAHPFRAKYSFEARFPATGSGVRDPVAASVDSPFFAYSVTSTFRGNVARTVMELETRKAEVPVAEAGKFA